MVFFTLTKHSTSPKLTFCLSEKLGGVYVIVCWLWGGAGGEFPQKPKFLSGIKMIWPEKRHLHCNNHCSKDAPFSRNEP